MVEQQPVVGSDYAQEETMMSMAELLEESFNVKKVQRGETLVGKIVRVSPTEVLIDVGAKSEGIVSGREMDRLSPEDLEQLQPGDEVSVYVLRPEDEEDGHIALSLSRAWVEKDWKAAQKLYDAGDIYKGTVSGHNKGGLIVHFGRVRGFVPVSQLDASRGINRSAKDEHWSQLVGEEMHLKIIEIDRRRNRLILSERAAMQEWRKGQKDKLLSELEEKQVISGRVTSLADFGAFVDIGGADGLIHLSEISWAPVSHPSEVLQVGNEVEVYVLQVDADRQRISLSLKRLQPEPWSQVLDKYEIGQVVDAVITRLASFGAFARVEDVEGLIHISELSDANITHPREAVNEGDEVSVKIIHIDPERRRMGLSLKQGAGVSDWEDYQDATEDDDADVDEEVQEAVDSDVPAEEE
jgi:small subunit ribosomal protein S1